MKQINVFLLYILALLCLFLPFVLAVDTTAPTVHLVWPEDNHYFNISTNPISFDWNISDDIQIKNLTRYIWNPSNDVIDINSTGLSGISNQSNDTAYYFEFALPSYSIYHWNLYGCDNSSNCAWSQEGNYSLNYAETPNISVIKYLENSTIGCNSNTQFIINVTNTNDYNLTDILVNDTGPIGESISYSPGQSVPNETYFVSNHFVAWRINVSANSTSQILVNFTSGGMNGTYTNHINVTNSSGSEIASTETNYTLIGNCSGGGGGGLFVNLGSPFSGDTLTSAPFVFNYNVTGNGPANCSLWGNFTGEWAENQTNIIAFMGMNNFTITNLNDGTYLWNVMCTNGNESWAPSNQTFSVNTTTPAGLSVVKYAVNNPIECNPNSSTNAQFIINVTNNNDYNLTNITINDTPICTNGLCSPMSSPSPTSFVPDHYVSWTIDNLEPNASFIIYVNFSVMGSGNFTNTVRVSNESEWLMNASGNLAVTGNCSGPGMGGLNVNFTNFPSYPDEYFNISGRLMIFASEILNLTGYANSTNFANWTISLENSSGIVNSSLCFGNYSVNGTFCTWNTTKYCSGECENYTLILNAADLFGNSNTNLINSITIDNIPPNISIINSTVNNYDWTVRANVTENYLSELDSFVLNENNSLIIYWPHLCNESQGNNCEGSGSGISNITWGFDTYSLNNDSVPLYYILMLDSYFAGNSSHPGDVPGCFASDGLNYDCGGMMPYGKPYTYYLVYNFSGENISQASLAGIGSEQWCSPGAGCVLNTTIIQNGISKFKPQAEYFNNSNGEWTNTNITEITLYSIGNSSNIPLVNTQAGTGNYTFIFNAQDYAGWGASSGIIEDITMSPFSELNSILNPDIFSWQNINESSMGFASRTMNLTGYANGTDLANWTISLENSSGIVINSSLCFGNYSVNGTFCTWNTTEYCAGECENYTLILNTANLFGNGITNWIYNITIDNRAPEIYINVSVNGSNVFAIANITEKYLRDDAAYILNESNYLIWGWGRFCGENQGENCSQLAEGTFNKTWQSGVYYLNNTLAPVDNKFGFAGINNTPVISIPGCFASDGVNYDCGGTCENQSICNTYRWWLVYNDTNHDGRLLGLANEQWCFPDTGCVLNTTIIQNGTSKFKVQRDHFDFNSSEWLHDNSTVVTLYNISGLSNINVTSTQVTNGTYKFAFEASDYEWTKTMAVEFNASEPEGPGPGMNVSTSLTLLNLGRPNVGDTIKFLINVTNTGSANISNLTISDGFDMDYNYTNASLVPNGVNYVNYIISWNNISVNLSQGQSYPLYINFSALSTAHNVLNTVNFTIYYESGDSSTSSSSFNFEIGENVAPTIDFRNATTETGNYSRNSIWANVTVGDSSPISSITIFLFNSTGLYNSNTDISPDPNNNTFFVNFTNLPEGTYRLNATANDTWGNINLTETRIILLDTTAPTLTIHLPLANSYQNYNNILINWTVNDTNYNSTLVELFNSTNDNITSGTVPYIWPPYTYPNYVVNYTDMPDDVYRIVLTAYDTTLNNVSTTIYNVTVDTVAPTINITSPINKTYNNATILVNISSDGDYKWFFNGTGNETYTIPVNKTFADGNYTLIAYANDSAGNLNSSSVTFNVDASAPLFNNPTTFPSQPVNYSVNQIYYFNVTLDGTEANVWYYWNGTNYTNAIGLPGHAYTFNRTGLPVGIYEYQWFANDSSGNFNQTSVYNYTINKATPSITALLNGNSNNLTITYPQQFNASGSANAGTLAIYMNNSEITNGQNYSLAAGYYKLNFNVTGNENYTNASLTLYATINKASQNALLSINETSPITYGKYINVSCNGELFRDNQNVTGEISQAVLLGAGNYNYSCRLNEIQNYSYAENNSIFVVGKASGNIKLLLNGIEDNLSLIYNESVNASISSTINGNLTLYRDDSNITSENNVNVSLASGYYNYTAYSSGNQNYSSVSITRYANVSKKVPSASLTNNTLWTRDYDGTFTTIGYSENNTGDEGVSYLIYKNGTNMGSSTAQSSAGAYAYVLNTTGGTNYSASASLDSNTLIINKEASSCGILFNETSPITYPASFKVWSNCTSNFTLYRNSTLIDNNSNQSLAAGTYNFTVIRNDTQNYSNVYDSQLFQIDKAIPTGDATGTSPIIYGTAGDVSGTESNLNDVSCNYTLYRNGTLVLNPDTTVLGVGVYNYVYNTTGCINYSANASLDTFVLTVNQNPEKVYTLFNTTSPVNYPTAFLVYSNATSAFTIYRNGTEVNDNSSQGLAAGTYNFTTIRTDHENYSDVYDSQLFQINKSASDIVLTLNNSGNNITILDIGSFGTSIWLNATVNNSQGNILLYKNGTLIDNRTSPLANYTLFNQTGLYTISAFYNETQNYTSSSETLWVNATDQTAPLINVLSPGNTSYFVGQLIGVNFSASDLSNVSSLWYDNTTENVTFNGTETYLNLTNNSYIFIFYANDSYNNIANMNITFTIKEIEDNQVLLNDSSPTIGENTTELILPANLNLTTISIPSNRSETEPITLNLGQRIDSNGNMSFGENNVSMNREGAVNYSLEIPASVVISGGPDWNGEFVLPTVKSTSGLSSPSIEGYTTTLEKVISVGSSSSELNFSNPVKLVIGGMAGKKAAWSRNSSFTNIATYCNNNESTPTNINSSARECYTDDSTNTDLIIWTLHFTDFAAYSSTAVVNNPGGGSSGGGGSTCTTNWTCSSWSSCVNGTQIRNCAKIKPTCSAVDNPIENQSCSSLLDNNLNNSQEQTNKTKENSNKNDKNEGEILKSKKIGIFILVVCIILAATIFIAIILYRRYKKRRYHSFGY